MQRSLDERSMRVPLPPHSGGRTTAKALLDLTHWVAGMFLRRPDPVANTLVAQAQLAQQELAAWSEERVDSLLEDLADAVRQHASELAALNVAETGLGNAPDKVIKIALGASAVLASLKGRSAAGVVGGTHHEVVEIAAPFGVVLGLVPVTNPVSTFTSRS